MVTDIPDGTNLTAPPFKSIVHPKRHAKKRHAKCPVCHVKYRAGEHKRVCQGRHRLKWFVYKMFHKAP